MKDRVISRCAAVIGIVATLVLATMSPAAAATARNGICEIGEFCLYKGMDWTGSVSDFNASIPNYGSSQPGCYEFKSGGLGQGQCVKNNALSAENRSNRVVRIYYNSNYSGIYVTFQPGDGQDGGLGYLDHENASHKFF